jgi:hypothetical protein
LQNADNNALLAAGELKSCHIIILDGTNKTKPDLTITD